MVKILAFLAALTFLPGAGLFALVMVAIPGNLNCVVPTSDTSGGGGGAVAPEKPAETRSIVFPLVSGTWVRTSTFGWRTDPISGETRLHTGLDLGAADGTPIMAVADGYVTFAGMDGSWGGLIIIEHTIDGKTVATAYVHMWAHGIHVSTGDTVTAGQHIGDVGSSGWSTGAHLHLEIRPGGSYATAIDPEPWLAAHGAADLTGVGSEAPGRAGCNTEPESDTHPDDADGNEVEPGRKESEVVAA